MGRLRFFLKVAFICNICFLLAEASYYIDYKGHFSELLKYILLMGIVVSFPLNLLVLFVAAIMLYRRKIAWAALPPYVFIVNAIILIVQFYFLF
ncbi:hypothetical protein [Chitinophaga filiformis]|uniref:Uncharacterized protein n=1 Tax=Chitinophaga filiformis TaxID=104663 RepID=A0A1G7MPR6_CHIFI|nr:hypothetical protein [Chitinophaga filiformis]SDF63775.1 hypothetical protein SAMN04488121_102521 [Chitinophaga filiformis]